MSHYGSYLQRITVSVNRIKNLKLPGRPQESFREPSDAVRAFPVGSDENAKQQADQSDQDDANEHELARSRRVR